MHVVLVTSLKAEAWYQLSYTAELQSEGVQQQGAGTIYYEDKERAREFLNLHDHCCTITLLLIAHTLYIVFRVEAAATTRGRSRKL